MKRVIPLLLVAMLLPAAVLHADDNKNLESKSTEHTRAAAVDFRKELGIASPSLVDLGARIDAARESGDPIGLASIAHELGALEKATGKTADIKSDALAAEAIKLAQQRNKSDELKAVAAILPEQASAAGLDKAADAAAKTEDAAAAGKKNGGKSRGIGGGLHVDSRTNEPINIYVNGDYVGQVPPGGDGFMNINLPYGTTVLHAEGAWDGRYWDRDVPEVTGDFTWTLYP